VVWEDDGDEEDEGEKEEGSKKKGKGLRPLCTVHMSCCTAAKASKGTQPIQAFLVDRKDAETPVSVPAAAAHRFFVESRLKHAALL
jgi:hypothetical protein